MSTRKTYADRQNEALERQRERDAKHEEWDNLIYWHEPTGSTKPHEPEWLIKDFLPRSYLMLFAGPDKKGKTDFLNALMLAVAKGQPFLGLEVNQGTVLWCAQEENLDERRIALTIDEDVRTKTLPIAHAFDIPPVDTDDGYAFLERQIFRVDPKLIIIDPLYGATCGRNLQQGHIARKAMKNLKLISSVNRIPIIVAHHVQQSNPDRIADSIQLRASSSMNVTFSRKECPGEPSYITLHSRGRGAFANRHWLLRSDRPLHYEVVEDAPLPEAKPTSKEEAVLAEIIRKPATSRELIARTGLSDQTVRNILVRMQDERKIYKSWENRTYVYKVTAIGTGEVTTIPEPPAWASR